MKRGICKECGKERQIANSKFMLCPIHNSRRLAAGKPPKKYTLKKRTYKTWKGNERVKIDRRKAINRKFRKTGEGALFEKLESSRPPVCEVCGKYLKELIAHNFAHILPKSTYPSLRLHEENIAILCWDYGQGCHEKWDTKSKKSLQDLPEWKNIFDKAQHLKENYRYI